MKEESLYQKACPPPGNGSREESVKTGMDRENVVNWMDGVILLGLCLLVVFLPIAHTETVRAFSLGIPAGLWGIKMILQRQ